MTESTKTESKTPASTRKAVSSKPEGTEAKAATTTGAAPEDTTLDGDKADTQRVEAGFLKQSLAAEVERVEARIKELEQAIELSKDAEGTADTRSAIESLRSMR